MDVILMFHGFFFFLIGTFHVTTILMKHFTCYLLSYAYVVPSVKEA